MMMALLLLVSSDVYSIDDKGKCAYDQQKLDTSKKRPPPSPTDISLIFKNADTNNDNKLSVKEAVVANIHGNFVALDANLDRFITPSEVNLWLKNGIVSNLWMNFRKIDSNMDLKLSEIEMYFKLPKHSKNFNVADINKDGFLDFDELIRLINPKIQKQQWFRDRLIVKDGVTILKVEH